RKVSDASTPGRGVQRMGPVAPSEPGVSAVAAMVLLLAVAIYGWLLLALRRFERSRVGRPPWWLGYARDGANLCGGGLLFLGLTLSGYPGPQSLALALSGCLLVYGLDAATAGRAATPGPTWWLVMGASAVGAALLAPARPQVSTWLAAVFAAL